jgi:hypothetical protein
MDSIKGGTMDQVPRKSIKLKDGKGQKDIFGFVRVFYVLAHFTYATKQIFIKAHKYALRHLSCSPHLVAHSIYHAAPNSSTPLPKRDGTFHHPTFHAHTSAASSNTQHPSRPDSQRSLRRPNAPDHLPPPGTGTDPDPTIPP